MPFSRSATQYWAIWVAPFGPARKRQSALLRSFELATASPALARLTADRFLTGCILSYHLEGVLGPANRANISNNSTQRLNIPVHCGIQTVPDRMAGRISEQSPCLADIRLRLREMELAWRAVPRRPDVRPGTPAPTGGRARAIVCLQQQSAPDRQRLGRRVTALVAGTLLVPSAAVRFAMLDETCRRSTPQVNEIGALRAPYMRPLPMLPWRCRDDLHGILEGYAAFRESTWPRSRNAPSATSR